MTKFRGLGVAVVFVAGCAVGGASSRFVVPSASAQQASTLTKWDYLCFNETGAPDVQAKAQEAGAQGWEMSGSMSAGSATVWCFKRPKM